MLRQYDSLSLTFIKYTRFQHYLQQLRTKSTRRYNLSKDNDGEKTSNRKKNQEDHSNIFLHKSRGQHILTNPRVLDSIIRRSNIKSTDTILEIGPGTGNLTLKLLEVANKVVAVEIDKRMVDILANRVAEHGFDDRLSIICKDALRTEFPPFDLVVANIPYGISSPLLAKLVFGSSPFQSATLLLQKEFARRLLANPGDSEFNRLAVNVKLVADVEFIMDVSKRDFLPCPKVDSSLVKIKPKSETPNVDLNEWWAFTRTCFSKKNKTLGATFKQKKKLMELLKLSKELVSGIENDIRGYNCNSDDDDDDDEGNEGNTNEAECRLRFLREKINGILKSGGFEVQRPSKMSIEELLQLLSVFNQAGIYFHDQVEEKDASSADFAASCSV